MITKIEIGPGLGECTYYFDGSDEPFSFKEYKETSVTRNLLIILEALVGEVNACLELVE